TALELVHGIGDRHSRRLRELTDAGEVFGVEVDDPLDEVVVGAGPGGRHLLIADVMTHRRGAWREEREIAAALSLQLELIGLDTLADLIIGDLRRGGRRQARILEARGLRLAKSLVRRGRGRVVAVTVDDHAVSRFRGWLSASIDAST